MQVCAIVTAPLTEARIRVSGKPVICKIARCMPTTITSAPHYKWAVAPRDIAENGRGPAPRRPLLAALQDRLQRIAHPDREKSVIVIRASLPGGAWKQASSERTGIVTAPKIAA